MKTIVIMPGGFHPFHAGHMALYDSVRKSFPGAEVYVAATDDTSQRPFPFAIKEKLAQLAGVEPGHFVKVKSPFQAKEIMSQYDPDQDRLIFVRSEKDRTKPPQAGGVKKNGEPAYLQPLDDATELAPFGKHGYMAYLPTVEFGPGMTSATEIRSAWPKLTPERKMALVMSLYPRTQGNKKLASNVIKMLDTAIGSVNENQGWAATYERHEIERDPELKKARLFAKQHYPEFSGDEDLAFDKWVQRSLSHSEETDQDQDQKIKSLFRKLTQLEKEFHSQKRDAAVDEGDAADPEQDRNREHNERILRIMRDIARQDMRPQDKTAVINALRQQMKKDHDPAHWNFGSGVVVEVSMRNDPEQGHIIYPDGGLGGYSPETLQQSVNRHLVDAMEHLRHGNYDKAEYILYQWGVLESKVHALKKYLDFMKRQGRKPMAANREVDLGEDYVEEKWSEKYKRSIDCDHPRGFSQRAHCAGRRKDAQ